jgi:hypothetical protein
MLAHWSFIEADLHEVFGIDVGDRELMARRTWPWLRNRAYALLSTESRLQRVLRPIEMPKLPGSAGQ